MKRGCNRVVFLVGQWAFKFPRPTGHEMCTSGWRNFLYGLLNNMNERETSGRPGACPVIWSFPGGFLNVMPRVEELSEAEFFELDWVRFCKENSLKVEPKRDSFGKLNGQVVAVDYGWPTQRW